MQHFTEYLPVVTVYNSEN